MTHPLKEILLRIDQFLQENARGARLLILIQVFSTLLSFLITGVIAVTNARSSEVNRRVCEGQEFALLRQGYTAVASQLPPDAQTRREGPARGTKDWRAMHQYFEQSFTEWETTTKLNSGQFRDLWSDFYEPLFRRVIQMPAFRDVASDLLTDEFAQGARGEFGATLRRLYWEGTGQDLRRGGGGTRVAPLGDPSLLPSGQMLALRDVAFGLPLPSPRELSLQP